ncbi:MAG: Rieske (2Fe-2S) protein, partial [Anaerolineae bacterium]
TRRGFLRWALGVSFIATLVGVLTPIIGYLWPPVRAAGAEGGRTLVGTIKDFPPGTGKVVPVGNKPVIVVNNPEQGIRAFSAICTHLGCIVLPKEAGVSYIQCPCHDGRFSPVTGAVISGPPPRPLPPYEFIVEKEQIYVGRLLGQLYGS